MFICLAMVFVRFLSCCENIGEVTVMRRVSILACLAA